MFVNLTLRLRQIPSSLGRTCLSPDHRIFLNYSMALFSGVLVVMALFFLQTGSLVDTSGDSQGRPTFAVSGDTDIPADVLGGQENDLNWWYANGSFKSEMISPGSSRELISALKMSGMWQAGALAEVTPLVVRNFPNDLAALEVSVKKKVFLNSLLPVVLVAMYEVQEERNRVTEIFEKLGGEPKNLEFSDSEVGWRQFLTNDEIHFVKNITRKYRSNNGAELLERINVLPVSLVLAQGALESSWGTSRFARLGNNIFGMWTWAKKGIVPLDRSAGMSHKIAQYDSVLDSVRAYVLTINRLPAYLSLREMRRQTMDSIDLSNGLLYYSERGEEYVQELQSVISYNGLTGYDQCRLAPSLKVMPLLAMCDN